jgi:hypothetical protein
MRPAAAEWDRLADQQERALIYGMENAMDDDYAILGLLSGVAIATVVVLLVL